MRFRCGCYVHVLGLVGWGLQIKVDAFLWACVGIMGFACEGCIQCLDLCG